MRNYISIILLAIFSVVANCQNFVVGNTHNAKPVPSWVSNGVIYQVWLRSFTPEGNLKAAAQRLPDLVELGVTIVYLCPISLADSDMRREFWSPRQKASPANNPRNPYRVADYNKVDPEYGTEKDLKEFIATAHKLGLHVILDIVYWHTGPANVLTKNLDFYQKDSNGKIKINEYGFFVLNYENKDLREYLYNNMKLWIQDFDIDGFRCDVSEAIPLSFWEDSRSRLDKIRPDIGMLAESNNPKEMLKAFDMNYGYPWYTSLRNIVIDGESASLLPETWEKMNKGFPANSLFTRFSDNHDLVRPVIEFSERGSRAISVLNFTIDGVPFLYNGQEFGDASPFGIYYYPEKSKKTNGSILWETKSLVKNAELRDWYKELIALRQKESVLRAGETIWIETDSPQSVVAFLRRKGNKDILTVVNLSNRIIKVKLILPEKLSVSYDPVFRSEKGILFSAGTATISLESFGYFIGRKNTANK
jgi:cyclomaltodextrinase / maltogenic alpha-amylase / neopullulanase